MLRSNREHVLTARPLATVIGMPGSFGGLNSLAERAFSPTRGIGAGIGGFLS